MMKYEDSQKITAQSVVIFSFLALLLAAAIIIAIDMITVALVLKTNLSESILKIASVMGSGIGIIVSTAFFTSKTKIKGIYSTIILSLIFIAIKIIGNMILQLGGYLSLNGLSGIIFTVIFALFGGVIGGSLRR